VPEINDARDVMWLALAFLLVAGGAALSYMLWRTARLLRRLENDLHRTVDEFVGVMAKSAVSVDTVNSQLEKLDLVLDSAVDMTEALDTGVRAVSLAVTEPVKKASAAFAGVTGAVDSFRTRMGEEDRTRMGEEGSTAPVATGAAAVDDDDDFESPFDMGTDSDGSL
jgi:uncharacterized protein YoxC